MSKFVTYPAVTVLDDDQSLLIDSPSAGTNSITAENAGNTLLSKWAGFDTFDEAVQNTISNNQEFIDRDTAIRSETADLKRKIVTIFPAKDASGQIATFESEFEDAPLKSCIVQVEPVQDLHGYDSPWPAGGGKNKFDADNPNIVEGYIGASSFSDGNSKAKTIYIAVSPNTTYTVSRMEGERFSIATSSNIPANNVPFSVRNANNTARSLTITSGADDTYLWAWVYLQDTDTVSLNDMLASVQIEEGSTATSYAPYENICPISGFTRCEVTRTWENVWDEEWESANINWSTYIFTPAVNGRFASKNYIPVVPNHTYYVNLNTMSTVIVGYTDTSGSGGRSITVNNHTDKLLTIPSDVRYIKFGIMNYGTTYSHDISINYPSTDHDYHPYTGQTYPITFPSEAGTVYGAHIDVINGELVVDRASEEFLFVNPDTNNGLDSKTFTLANTSTSTTSKDGKITNVVNEYVYAGASYEKPHFYLGRTGFVIYLKENTYRGGTVQVCYPLAEPIHYPITSHEVKSLLGQNNIWADTGDTSVEYLMSDVGWYVEKKLRAFQSILAGVEDSAVASKNYSTNSYLIFNDDIYRVTKTITAGETIEDGVNVTKTTVAEQLMALAQV